jgi:hypothetical protein
MVLDYTEEGQVKISMNQPIRERNTPWAADWHDWWGTHPSCYTSLPS